MAEVELNFEEAIERLEEIVENLETGGLSLNESLEKFTEGIKLIQFCNKELNKAEKKIELAKKEGNEFTRIVPYIEETER